MTPRLAEFGPLIDAEPARAHIVALREQGLSTRTISRLSGVSMKAIASLIWGVEGRPPTAHVRQDTADRLAAVDPRLELLAPLNMVSATGSRRRLQALVAVGWPLRRLAIEMPTTNSWVGKLARGRVTRVRVSTARKIRALYDRLWDVAPAAGTPRERRAVTMARQAAAERGWAPPMAWDDIDDPAAEPQGAGYTPARGKLPDASEIAFLVAGGDSVEVLADRYETSVDSVRQRLHRAKETTA